MQGLSFMLKMIPSDECVQTLFQRKLYTLTTYWWISVHVRVSKKTWYFWCCICKFTSSIGDCEKFFCSEGFLVHSLQFFVKYTFSLNFTFQWIANFKIINRTFTWSETPDLLKLSHYLENRRNWHVKIVMKVFLLSYRNLFHLL